MTNTSATGGYLLPSNPQVPNPAPLEDAALDTFIQQIVTGITGIAGTLVFPRWQVVQPNLPGITTNWASIGVMDMEGDTFAYEAHDPVLPQTPIPPAPVPPVSPPVNGYDIVIRHELLRVLCSFYGPNARSYASLMRDGLGVGQNREAMQLAGMGLVGVGKIEIVPSIVNTQWYYRADVPFTLRREIIRNYPILDLLSSQVTITSDQGVVVTTNP